MPQPQTIAVDEAFYRMLRLVNLTAKPFFTRFGVKHGLSINEWRIIIVLANRPGSSVQELADGTGLDKMSASRAVRRLIGKGRVARTRDPGDARRTLHRLTEAGLAVFRELAPSARRRVDELFDSLSPAEVRSFGRLIAKLERRAEAWTDEG